MTQLVLRHALDWLFPDQQDEPSTIFLLAVGLVMILAYARLTDWRKKRAAGKSQREEPVAHTCHVGVRPGTSAIQDDQQTDSGRVA
jgi:hypothetical protein